jgi:WD40 repeat protein
LVAACILGVLSAGRAWGQAEVRNPTQPIPVLNTGGHSGPVRSLVFATPDGMQLLSAGMDKVVNVWNLRATPPGLAQTIRPRIWRGYAGVIYTMALSPVADAQGQRLLAVAGFGVQNTRGEIGLFRFPGRTSTKTGDVVAELTAGVSGAADAQGHSDTVMALAFHPSGTWLASGSMDNTARIWDVTTQRTLRVLRGHTGPVNAVAFTPDGRRFVTAGGDGQVMLWDPSTGALLARAAPDPRRQQPGDSAADAINSHCLAVSPDGRWVVVGRENGDIVRYDAATLRQVQILPPGNPNQGAVEALAINHDGTKLATAVVSQRLTRPSERPRVDCEVELRSMPDGTVQRTFSRVSNLVLACAFSPDDRWLAYAGGDIQAIRVLDLNDLNRAPVELAGQGSSIWDVGFSGDSRAIGFARSRPDVPNPPREYEDFDLRGQRVALFTIQELSRAVTTFNGWNVRPVDPWTLDVINAQGQGHRIQLDRRRDRRWWSYTFLHPGPGHARPMVAIGCEGGVAIHSLDDGRRTRLFAGHHGPVYALAPSPDGRWLVTGSSDQTVRLWRLAGCDTLAPLGATFGPPPPGQSGLLGVVNRVEPLSFAEGFGLHAGDLVEQLRIALKEQTGFEGLSNVLPDTPIEIRIRREGQAPLWVGTTKRDQPALTLFPALDREWVVWTPHGLYETSIIGDRRYLGWHRNRAEPGRPTDFFAFDHFEKELRRPDALIRLWESADLAALFVQPPPAPVPVPAPQPPAPVVAVAPREPEQIVDENRLPLVEILSPPRPAFDPLVVPGARLNVRVRALSEDRVAGRGLIRSLRVLLDGGRTTDLPINPPVADISRDITLDLNPGRHRISVLAVNDRNKERTESFDVIAQEPAPPRPAPPTPPLATAPEPPRLAVLSVGSDRFGEGSATLPSIPFAENDVRDVAAFLGAPGGSPRYQRINLQTIAGPDARSDRVLNAFEQLDARLRNNELGQGDAVLVLIESHFVSFERQGHLLASNSAPGSPPTPSIPAERVSEVLGRLADYGCKVMLFIDVLHENRPDPRSSNRALNDWARDLYHRNVITFVASVHGPSFRVRSEAHGAFAEGILDSLNVRAQTRLQMGSPTSPSLWEFQDIVARRVLDLTSRQQHARCFIPDAVPSQVSVFDPPTRRQPRFLRAAND